MSDQASIHIASSIEKESSTVNLQQKRGKFMSNIQQYSLDSFIHIEVKKNERVPVPSSYCKNSDEDTFNNFCNFRALSSQNFKSKENQGSQFSINLALQLGSQIPYQNKKVRNKKLSEYFCVKKRSNTKSSNWISVDLFEENGEYSKNSRISSKDIHQTNGDIYHVKNEYDTNSVDSSLNWASRGSKTDKFIPCFSVPPNELFVKSTQTSNHKRSQKMDSKSSRKLKRIKCISDNKNIRQSKLYEYLMEKHKNVPTDNHQINDISPSNCMSNIKNDEIDLIQVSSKNEDRSVQLEQRNFGFKSNHHNLSEHKKFKQTSINSYCVEIPKSSSNLAEIFENSHRPIVNHNGTSKMMLQNENKHSFGEKIFEVSAKLNPHSPPSITTEMNEESEEIPFQSINPQQPQCSYQHKLSEDTFCSSSYSNTRNNFNEGISANKEDLTSLNTVYAEDIQKNVQAKGSFNLKHKTKSDKSELFSDLKNTKRVTNEQEVYITMNDKLVKNKKDEHEVTPMPEENLSTETAFHLLASVSSPIITDPECQEYLKDVLVNENQAFQISQVAQDNEEIVASQNVKEERTLHQFWETLRSQNAEDCSQNLNNSTGEFSQNIPQKGLLGKEKVSQDGSEIFNYILSQDYAVTNSLMDTAMKNMNDLSQKVIEKSNSIVDNNKNSNKLLELSLKIYSQHKERSVLSKQALYTIEPHSKFAVIRTIENDVCSYKIVQGNNVEYPETTPDNMHSLWTIDTSVKTLSESQGKILSGLKRICADKSYLYDESEDERCEVGRNKGVILQKITSTFEKVLEDFEAQRSPSLEIPRQTYGEWLFVNGRLEMKFGKNWKKIKVKYQNTSSQIKFCLIMYVLAKVLHALETNTRITRRELYYQVKHLISNQSQIDSAVRAVSYMFSVGPWDLNIVAHKGMVFGNLKIVLPSNVIDCNLPGTLIPQDVDEITELKSTAFFILVVEKESIFYKLLEEDLPNKLVRPFIMITGKGFPDLNTQLFLKKLWMIMNIPIFILTDADPHGIQIMMTYRFGSLANIHLSKQLVVPKAKWLGVFPSEVMKFNADKQTLTEVERNMIQNLLKIPFIKNHKRVEEELTFMANSGYKAGIEGIMRNNNFLSEFYFPLKFHNEDLK